MADDQRDIDVAALADRLAVVHRLQHREEALALVQDAGDGVEVAGACVAGELRPGLEGFSRRRDGFVDVLRRALGAFGEAVAARRIDDRESTRRRAGATNFPPMKCVKRPECFSSQARTWSFASGAGP